MMEILYHDKDIVVCVKPPRVLSTDEPGGVPQLVRQALGEENIRTVHRLDRVVGGLMVLAKRAKAAAELSRQIREGQFQKDYIAVVHGHPELPQGTLHDWLHRDKQEKKSYLVSQQTIDAQEAILHYTVTGKSETMSRVRVQLVTGRTHQIRAQFSGHGLPLVGDRKYGQEDEAGEIALWSCRLAFAHPYSAKPMEFTLDPPEMYPWSVF